MKKALLFLLLFLPLSTSAYFSNNLYFGIRKSADVEALQEFLTDEGVYTGPITGNFFSLTLKGVKAFQTREGISPISGYFGPLSRGRANAILTSQGVGETITDETGIPSSPATTSPKTTDDVVTKLNEQVKLLQEQNQKLQDIQTKQHEQVNTLGKIQENTIKPVLTPPTLPPPEPDKSGITIDVSLPHKTQVNGSTVLDYVFTVRVLNKDGSFSHDATVTMDAPDNSYSTQGFTCGVNGIGSESACTKIVRKQFIGYPPKEDWGATYSYRPIFPGTKIITFTSGTMTKTYILDVQ